jgi:hypothetical protein
MLFPKSKSGGMDKLMSDSCLLKHHIRFLEWGHHYALKPYIPAFSALRQKPKDSEAVKSTAWIYGFKQHFKNADDFRMIIEAAANHFGCAGILPIPPSHPGRQPNSLQSLFGTPIRRTKAAATRKYDHHQSLSDSYQGTYEINSLKGRRFLLVDDILRTGTTMNHFRVTLASMGCETVPLALGIYYRLPYQAADSISIFMQRSETDQALDEMILEI